MLTAFLEQSNINDKKADLDEAARKRVHEINHEKGVTHLSLPKTPLIEAINGPSKLDPKDLTTQTETHEQFKNYELIKLHNILISIGIAGYVTYSFLLFETAFIDGIQDFKYKSSRKLIGTDH